MILDSPIISGSLTQQAGQIAEIPRYTDVSSSFLAASASFDSRIGSMESTTPSLSPRLDALESFTASADSTYVNANGDSMSGNLTITGSLVVTDRITAQEFHTEYVSSSVVYESGSTKFGDSLDDTHSFTGSVDITGSITLNGSAIGTGKLNETTFNSYTASNDSKVDSLISATGSYETIGRGIISSSAQLPIGLISSSAQLPSGIVSGSDQLTSSLDLHYIVSGTITQTTWDNIENKPNGIVSGSSQLPSGLISGSEQLPIGVVSGSSQITLQDTTGQLSASRVDGLNLSQIATGSWTASVANDEFNIIHDGSNIFTLTSGSTNINNGTLNITADSFANDFAEGYTELGLALNVEGDLDITGSIEVVGNINADEISGSFSGSYQGDGSLLRGLAAGAKFHTQTIAASTWTFIHNLSTQYPNVTVYDSNNNIVLPQSITATNVDTLVLEFGSPVAGYATAGVGGIIEVNGRTIKQHFVSSLEWRFEHNFGDRYPMIQVVDENYEVVLPQSIVLTDTTSSLITFPEATTGYAIGTIGGDLPSISSSYAGYTLQISSTTPYTASWVAAVDVIVTNALTASYVEYSDVVNKPSLVSGSSQIIEILDSLNSFTASNSTTNTFTSSASARLDSLETTSASVNDTNISQNSRLDSLEAKTGSLATTGSNTFFGTQTFSGSVYIKENLIVQGSSSLQNITASAVDIGTNKIILNVDNPSIRYAGISVYDSGSTSGTGSLFWDSVNNYWLYEHPADSGAPYNSAILISGPKNEGNLGEESGLVNNYIVKAVGGDHISSSAIYDDGTTVRILSNAEVTGSLKITSNVGIGTSSTYPLAIYASATQTSIGLLSGYSNSGARNWGLASNALTYGDLNLMQSTAQGGEPFSAGTSRLYISPTGNIGIGTTNPGDILDVRKNQNATTNFYFRNTDTTNNSSRAYLNVTAGSTTLTLATLNAGDVYIAGTSDRNMYFQQNIGGTVNMAISGSGDVGIGTANPNYKLEIQTISTKAGLWVQTGGTTSGYTIADFRTGTNASALQILGNTTSVFGGNVGIGTNSPGRKLIVYGGTTDAGLEIFSSNGTRTAIIAGRGSSSTALHQGYFQMTDQGTATVALDTAGNSYLTGGNVGIGTTSPNSMIHIDGGGTRALRVDVNSGVQGISISPNGIFGIDEPGVGNGRFIINTNGRVGIGVTNPNEKLHVNGNMQVNDINMGGVWMHTTTGFTTGAGAFTYDVNVGDEGGGGNVFKVEAAFAHYAAWAYNCMAEFYISTRGTNYETLDVKRYDSGLAGTFTAYKSDNSTLRISKSSGSYGGGGRYWIRVTKVIY